MSATKVGLIGKFRSGKSLLAGHAILTYDFQPFAFGDELKRSFHALFPQVPREPKPRAFYQQYGTLMREIDPNVWLNATMRDIERYTTSKCACQDVRVLVEDIRQENEVERLRAEGFTLIRVTAPDELRVKRAKDAGDVFSEAELAHATELASDGFAVDYEIMNDGDLMALYERFDEIMRRIGVEKR